jgi:hypothetical protein
MNLELKAVHREFSSSRASSPVKGRTDMRDPFANIIIRGRDDRKAEAIKTCPQTMPA